MPQVNMDVYNQPLTNLIPYQQQNDAIRQKQISDAFNAIADVVSTKIKHDKQQSMLKKMGLLDSKGNIDWEGLKKNLPSGASVDLSGAGVPMTVKGQDPYDQLLKTYMMKQLGINVPQSGNTVSPQAMATQPSMGTQPIQPNIADYQNIARQGGTNIVGTLPGASQTDTMNMLNKMFQQKGLTPPQPTMPQANPTAAVMPPQQPAQSNLGTPEIGLSATGKPTLRFKQPSSSAAGVTSQQDIVDSVKGAFDGTVPPERLASWRDVTRVNAEIKRQSEKNGMNFPDLLLEWDATKKFVSTAQSSQQVRLRQAIDFAQQSTKDLKKLSQDFKRTNFPILNKAQLSLAMNGAYGQDNAKKATIFNQQLTDIVADLGNVYMGGNSPTDEGLRLAQQNLRSNWSVNQLNAAIENVDKLLTFRSNSLKNAAPMYGGKMGTKYYKQPQMTGQEDNSQITEENIQHTLKLHPEITREQLLKKLGVQ
jgi:hypothetical protein